MFKKNTVLIITLLLLVGILMGGCFTKDETEDEVTSEIVTLYFSDDQAMYLVAEEREVVRARDENLAELVVNELIKGPESDDLYKTIPPEARLLSVTVEEGVAYLDFSKEIKTEHWGGSTGETFTILSLANSLGEIDGIDKMQILIEGEIIDSLAGHFDCSEPFEPSWDIVKQ